MADLMARNSVSRCFKWQVDCYLGAFGYQMMIAIAEVKEFIAASSITNAKVTLVSRVPEGGSFEEIAAGKDSLVVDWDS